MAAKAAPFFNFIHMNIRKAIFSFLLFFGFVLLHAQEETPNKILFVGNSYTYFWNLPHTVDLLAESEDIDITTKQSTAGGANWAHHWKGERNLKTKEIIAEGDFDIVVIQNHSMSTIDRPDSLMYYGELLNEHIRKSGAQTYLYMTWAREWNPYMMEPIKEKYTQLAEKINARIVPVGLAWQRARELRPDFPLYFPDGSHQSALGTYLSACVFYGILTGKSPVGLTSRLISEDKYGEKIYIQLQTAEDALFCQKVAEEIINEYID